MRYYIQHQEEYDRGQLLLRSFLGFFYIVIPHYIGWLIFGFIGMIYGFIACLSVLFTGKYPRNMFDFQVKLQRWTMRVMARLLNLTDGYPKWGMDGTDDKTDFDVPYPEKINQGLQWIKVIFGIFYVMIPHGVVLYFRMLGVGFVYLISWLSILFTGKYPKNMHDFVVGTLRWSQRVNLYMGFMSDKYPPFSAALQPGEDDGPGGNVGSSREDILDS